MLKHVGPILEYVFMFQMCIC